MLRISNPWFRHISSEQRRLRDLNPICGIVNAALPLQGPGRASHLDRGAPARITAANRTGRCLQVPKGCSHPATGRM